MVLYIELLFHFLQCRYIVLFNILNHEKGKNKLKEGFSHYEEGIGFHVKGKTVDVKRKGFNVKRITARGDGRNNGVDIKGFIENVFTFIVDVKCTIASKKTFAVR